MLSYAVSFVLLAVAEALVANDLSSNSTSQRSLMSAIVSPTLGCILLLGVIRVRVSPLL